MSRCVLSDALFSHVCTAASTIYHYGLGPPIASSLANVRALPCADCVLCVPSLKNSNKLTRSPMAVFSFQALLHQREQAKKTALVSPEQTAENPTAQ